MPFPAVLPPRAAFRTAFRQAGLRAAALGLGVGILAACGAVGGSNGADASTTCGTTRTGANVPVIVKVARGSVSCTTAMHIENSYAAMVRAGDIRGNGGGAPVTINGWTCQGFPTPKVLRTGQTSACRSDGSEVLAVLPPPSEGPSTTDASGSRPISAGRPGPGQPARRTAPRRRSASATAASRAAVASAAVSVRSGARNRSVYASDLRPAPTCSPV